MAFSWYPVKETGQHFLSKNEQVLHQGDMWMSSWQDARHYWWAKFKFKS